MSIIRKINQLKLNFFRTNSYITKLDACLIWIGLGESQVK
jgi:hypothetical protein